MRLLFIRHAETETNVNRLTHKTGDTVGLTEKGKRQAEELIQKCGEENIETIFSSPEQRAVETAQIIAEGLGLEYRILDGLTERNWGQWEGKPWSEIEKALSPMSLEERYTFTPPGGESWEQMETRLQENLTKIIKCEAENVAIITHEGALRGLMPLFLRAPKESSFQYHFENAEIIPFSYENGIFTRD